MERRLLTFKHKELRKIWTNKKRGSIKNKTHNRQVRVYRIIDIIALIQSRRLKGKKTFQKERKVNNSKMWEQRPTGLLGRPRPRWEGQVKTNAGEMRAYLGEAGKRKVDEAKPTRV